MKTENRTRMNKKGIAPLVIGAIILIGILVMAGGYISIGGLTSSTVDGYVDVPHFATIKCEQSGASKSYSAAISSGGDWLDLPLNTNENSIILQAGSLTTLSFNQFEYWICPQKGKSSNCNHQTVQVTSAGQNFNIGTFSSNSFIFATYETRSLFGISSRGGASFIDTYKPFTLVRYDSLRGGQQDIAAGKGCELPTDDVGWANRITSTVGISVPDGIARDNKLNVGEKFNYVSGSVTRLMSGNTQTYNGVQGYCIYSNAQGFVYPIKQVTTASATYNVVDVSGQALGVVQCCNGDNLPDKTCTNGQWVSTKNEQCNILNPCEGTEWRRDLNNAKQVIKYQCVSGTCQAAVKTVECSQDSDCRTNQKCSTSTWTCVQAGDTVITVPGDERLQTNEMDCTKAGNTWKAKTTEKQAGICGIMTLGLWNCGSTVVVEAHCEKPAPLWKSLMWFLLIAGAILLAIKFLPPVIKASRGIVRK